MGKMIWLLAAACLLPVGLLLVVSLHHSVLLDRHSDELDAAYERLMALEEANERRLGL